MNLNEIDNEEALDHGPPVLMAITRDDTLISMLMYAVAETWDGHFREEADLYKVIRNAPPHAGEV